MLKNNDLLAQLKGQLREAAPRAEGRVKATDRGFGFLETDDDRSFFIAPPQMKSLMHGDLIRARIETTTDKQGQAREAAIPEALVETGLKQFVGQAVLQGKQWFIQPLSPSIRTLISLPNSQLPEDIQAGDWLQAHLTQHPLEEGGKRFMARVIATIARQADPFALWSVTLAQLCLPAQPPEFEINHSLQDPPEAVREDLTHLAFFTLDSRSTTDMDDALHIEALDGGGWCLKVAVADPSAYVPADSPIDQEARQRGFTQYLPSRTVSMLPTQLADDLCSLHPDQKRPAVVASLQLDAQGALTQPVIFCLAWISSQAKLDYNRVSDWFEKTGAWQPASAALADQLTALADLMTARQQWRQTHALVHKDQPDYRFILDEQAQVLDIRAEQRRIAHKMVEEAMLLANMAAADFFAQHQAPAIFHAHQGLDPERINAAIELLKTEPALANCLTLDPSHLADLQGFRELRQWLDQHPTPWLEGRLRKHQGLAYMTHTPTPHFGLGVQGYATWTSPIRKYCDLYNHRLIKALITSQSAPSPDPELLPGLLQARKLNRQAENAVKEILYIRYFAQRMDQTWSAEVIQVNRGGMRVRLLDTGALVFVPASELHSDRKAIKCDSEQGQILIQDQPAFRLGDALTLEIFEADETQRKLLGRPVQTQSN